MAEIAHSSRNPQQPLVEPWLRKPFLTFLAQSLFFIGTLLEAKSNHPNTPRSIRDGYKQKVYLKHGREINLKYKDCLTYKSVSNFFSGQEWGGDRVSYINHVGFPYMVSSKPVSLLFDSDHLTRQHCQKHISLCPLWFLTTRHSGCLRHLSTKTWYLKPSEQPRKHQISPQPQ